MSGSSKIQTLLPSNKIRYFFTELQNLKPCGEISITLDGNNVWISHKLYYYTMLMFVLHVIKFSFANVAGYARKLLCAI